MNLNCLLPQKVGNLMTPTIRRSQRLALLDKLLSANNPDMNQEVDHMFVNAVILK